MSRSTDRPERWVAAVPFDFRDESLGGRAQDVVKPTLLTHQRHLPSEFAGTHRRRFPPGVLTCNGSGWRERNETARLCHATWWHGGNLAVGCARTAAGADPADRHTYEPSC